MSKIDDNKTLKEHVNAVIDVYIGDMDPEQAKRTLDGIKFKTHASTLDDWMRTVFDTVKKTYDDYEQTADVDSMSSLSILAAEDSLVNQLILRGCFKGTNHVLTIASNGQEAFDLAKDQLYDLLIFDIQMPEMNGWDALKNIKGLGQEWQDVPSIGLTAFVNETAEMESSDEVFDILLGKPFDKETLLKSIKKAFLLRKSIG